MDRHRTLIAKKLKNININTANNKNQLTNENNENVDVIWINLFYLGKQGDQLLISLKYKITRCLIKKVKFKVTQSTQKFCFYISVKDQINKLMKPYFVYQFCYRQQQFSVQPHLWLCELPIYKNLHCIGNKSSDAYAYDTNSIQKNTNVIDSATNWNKLLIKKRCTLNWRKQL